jgi:hypothetical protein
MIQFLFFQLLKGKGQARLDALKGSVVVGGTNFRKMQDPNATGEICASNVFLFRQSSLFSSANEPVHGRLPAARLARAQQAENDRRVVCVWRLLR